MAFFKVNSYVPKNNIYFWAFSRDCGMEDHRWWVQKKCHFWSGGGGGGWQAFQLSLWTDTKERVKTAKTIQLQKLIRVWIWSPGNTALVEWENARNTLYFLFPPTQSLLQLWSENHYIDLIFFQQRRENGLPSKLSKRLTPALLHNKGLFLREKIFPEPYPT